MKRFITTFMVFTIAIMTFAQSYTVFFDATSKTSTNFTVNLSGNSITIRGNRYSLQRMGTIRNSGITFNSYLYGSNDLMFCVATSSMTVQVPGQGNVTGYMMLINQRPYLARLNSASTTSYTATMSGSGNPYHSYVSRFIVENNGSQATYRRINNPITLTSNSLYVKNTNAGDKRWDIRYLGSSNTNLGGSYQSFHNFYLTNKGVIFNISENPFYSYGGKKYYLIIFDGQIQLAE